MMDQDLRSQRSFNFISLGVIVINDVGCGAIDINCLPCHLTTFLDCVKSPEV